MLLVVLLVTTLGSLSLDRSPSFLGYRREPFKGSNKEFSQLLGKTRVESG